MNWWWVLVIEAGIILLFVLFMLLASIPELKRYMNLRSM